jgi:chloramphenicol 3-O-phosphotransferase
MPVLPENNAAVEFLKRWDKKGPWVLTAIHPNRKEIDTRTFSPTQTGLKALSVWLEEFNGTRNIYFSVNRVRGELTKKATREDIAEMPWLHVDIDPRAGEELKEEQARALALLSTKLPQGVPAPTVIVFSGGGYQGFWKLEKPIEINGDLVRAEDAKRYNQQLELLFGADACHNIDRIMRLPGTINIPNAVKKKKGRKAVLATLVQWEADNVYALDRFTPAPQVQMVGETGFGGAPVQVGGNIDRYSIDDLDKWNIPDRLKVIIVQGNHPEEKKEGDNSRSSWLFDVCCNLVRHGVPDEVVFSIITDPDFGISGSVIEQKDPAKYALRQIGRAKEEAIDPWLRKLNDKYAVIGNMGGKCRVIEEIWDPVLQRPRLTRQSFDDFRNRHMHKTVQAGVTQQGKAVLVPLGNWWLKQPQRRQYDGLVFAPGQEIEGSYNMWKGFACQSLPGDCNLFLDHVRNNVCSGNEYLYAYLMGWMARCIQQPDSPGHTAIVLRGMRGVGKSIFAKIFGSLFGRHFLHISNPSHLVGNFNAHLRDTVVLFADEAFYAGDKKHVSILKTLITEETISIEAKGIDVETAPNFVHLIMASNDDHVIPAGGDERRFLVLDVGRGHQKDGKYFSAMMRQMDKGGREALLYHLMHLSLAGFDVRDVPDTAALHEQKMYSLQPEEDWWYQKLLSGQLIENTEGWPKEIGRDFMLADFLHYTDRFRISRRGSATALGKFLSKVCPGLRTIQRWGELNGGAPARKTRLRFYQMSSLAVARAQWDDLYGKNDWPVDDVEQQELPLDNSPK